MYSLKKESNINTIRLKRHLLLFQSSPNVLITDNLLFMSLQSVCPTKEDDNAVRVSYEINCC